MVPLQLSSVSIEKLNVYLHVWIPEVLAYATSTVWDRPITKAKSSAVGLEPKFSSSVNRRVDSPVVLLYVLVRPLMPLKYWRLRLECVIAVTPVHIFIPSHHFKLSVLYIDYCAIGKSMTSVRGDDSSAALFLCSAFFWCGERSRCDELYDALD